MKKIFLCAIFLCAMVCFPSFVALAKSNDNQPKILTLETRMLGFAFQGKAYSVARLRFYYSAAPVPNSDKGEKLVLTNAKFKFRGEYYKLNFMYQTKRRIEADIVIPTNKPLDLPIGHLSLRIIGSLMVGTLKIYPQNDTQKEGSGEFNLYLNTLLGPSKWKDLNKDKDKKEWYK